MNKLTKTQKSQLEFLYLVEKRTLQEIAALFNVSRPAIGTWLKKLGIPRRTNSEAQLLSNGTENITCELLDDLYTNQELSQSQVASYVGLSQTGICYRLSRCNIKTRSKANFGSANGMFGKTHTPEAKAKIREANRQQFEVPGARLRQARITTQQIADGRTGKAFNKLETKFAAILDKMAICFVWQYRLNRYVFDFFLPDTNTLIEIHGTFWHADPRFYDHASLGSIQQKNVANDVNKKQTALDRGFNYTCVWEHDIHNAPSMVIKIMKEISMT